MVKLNHLAGDQTMQNAISRHVVMFAVAALGFAADIHGQAPQNSRPTPATNADAWPREVKSGGTTFLVHQPQIDSWDGRKAGAYSGVEVKKDGSDKPVYGVLTATANTDIDKANRTVEFKDLRLTKVSFPGAPDMEGLYLRILQNNVMPKVRRISLDLFEASIAIMEAENKVELYSLKNDPPKIILSAVPAILIYIDGDAAYRPIKGTKLERVINTRPLVVREPGGKHYLHLFDGWMEAGAPEGPWNVCKTATEDLKAAMKDAVAGGQVDLLEGKGDPQNNRPKPSLSKGPVPTVYVATAPTELIVTEGEPKFASIPGTALTYAENTTGHIFRHSGENRFYVLISGRWFRAPGLKGPWEFAPYGELPPDFASIPDDSPKENVKASVPDTAQANEAVIANSIPQMATVNRKKAVLNPLRFDGEPQFKPLETTTLHYVVNTSTPIIRVDETTYYAVENGVWFKSLSLKGPWVVTDSVPTVIYTIPPSAPLHYVTYVRIYGSNADTVTVGYTPGYYGSVVTHGSGSVVVYGTGYPYYPWVGTTWFGPPVTYGFGTSMTYTPWSGWAFSFGFGWSWGYPPYPAGWGWGPYPWWGPVGWGYYYPYPYYAPIYGGAAWGPGGAVAWGPGGWAGTTGNVYHRWGSTQAVTRSSGGFNAYTGNRWANQVGMSYNSKTGNLAAGQRAAVANVYTGGYAYGRRGAVTNTETGKTISGGRVNYGNVESGQSGSAGWIRGENGGAVRAGDSIYAAQDGTVYRKGSNGWEQNSGSGWSSVDGNRPTPNRSGEHIQNRQASSGGQIQNRQYGGSQMSTRSLDRQQAARATGQMRTQSYRSGSFRSAGGFRRR